MTVDILLPFYGDVALMQLAVRSVLGQRNPDWRLTVVDDGYPDESIPGWFAGLGEQRVRYFRNETNLGANGNYNLCLTKVEHELVVVMGADDVMLPNYVDVVLAAHEAFPQAAIIQPGVDVIDEHGMLSRNLVDWSKKNVYAPRGHGRRLLAGEHLAASLLRGDWLYFPSLCWRAEEITRRGFQPGLDVVQDLALVLDIVAAGGSMLVDDTVCFQYRRHAASDSSWRALEGTRFAEERRFFAQAEARMRELGWLPAARVARRHLSSRINAATLLPKAVKARQTSGVRNLGRHVLGPRVSDLLAANRRDRDR